MALYFFDTHDDGKIIIEDVGLEYPNLERVKVEAARSLAELARDVLPTSIRREMAVFVRDARSRHVLKTSLIFEVVVLV